MLFDPATLYLVATMVAAMLGAMLLFFGRQEKIPALIWWGAAYLLGAASVALWTVTGSAMGGMFTLTLNAVGFVACGMVWNAARVFHGRKPNLPGLVLGALAWIAAVTTVAPAASAMRMTIGAGIVAIYAALTASELWTERRRRLQRRWPAIVVPVLHGLVLMLPILLGDFMRPRDAAFTGGIWVTVFSIELVLYAVGTVFVIFMLVSERTVTAHKTAASMDPLTGMFNRRGFAEATARVIEREANAGRPVTVLIFDIDHFKSINDRFGHPAGDEILKLFATVRGSIRCGSAISRGVSAARSSPRCYPVRLTKACWRPNACARRLPGPALRSRKGRSTPPSASALPAGRPAPNSKFCWRQPTPRSIRPSAAVAIASKRLKNCRCRWRSGGERPRASQDIRAPASRARHSGKGRGNVPFTIIFIFWWPWTHPAARTPIPP